MMLPHRRRIRQDFTYTIIEFTQNQYESVLHDSPNSLCSHTQARQRLGLGLTSINDLLSFYVEPLGLFDLVLDVQDGFRFRGFDVEYL